jgi:hypothetical protein
MAGGPAAAHPALGSLAGCKAEKSHHIRYWFESLD